MLGYPGKNTWTLPLSTYYSSYGEFVAYSSELSHISQQDWGAYHWDRCYKKLMSENAS